jgi:adenylate cyclase
MSLASTLATIPPPAPLANDDLFIMGREIASTERSFPPGSLVDWMLAEAARGFEGVELFDGLCWRLLAAGVPLLRANLSIATLHPQIRGLGYRWQREPGITREFRIRHGLTETDDYLRSPMRAAIEQGVTVRHRLDGAGAAAAIERFPFLGEIKAAGATDYLACPLSAFIGRHRVVTWASDRPGGFTEADIAQLDRILPALALIVETKTWQRLSGTLLDLYLGKTIGQHILAGEITRGQGKQLRAALMSVDLRGFTHLADRMQGAELISLLDEYFDAVAASVHEQGGEILKFVGDGALAIFEPEGRTDQQAAAAALAASERALERLNEGNERRAAVGGVQIRVGIGLHIGDVTYGNVGAVDRLDFTAIGPAVNLVCRLEQLTKRVGRPLLVSSTFVRACPHRRFDSLSFHPVRGLSEPQEVFAPTP